MTSTKEKDEVYICEACGHPTTVANDTCPSCGAPMTNLADTVKPNPGSEDDDSDELTDDQIAAGNEEGTLSLDALREDEEKEDEAETTDIF